MNRIKIFNVRYGFANNSSSTHSIIFLKDELDKQYEDYDGDGDFGWDNFTLQTKDSLLQYLGTTLLNNLSKLDVHPDYIEYIVEGWMDGVKVDSGSYVDHQSLITLPLTYDESGINKLFFNQLKQLFIDNPVIILGGNDNSYEDERHPLLNRMLDKGTEIDFWTDSNRLIAKYDNEYNYWTLFNKQDGRKTRCILSNKGREEIIPVQASTPDIVDVKITQKCSYGCTYCYMGSTKEGTHAPYEHLKEIVSTLSNNEILEIAYGGGEPTEHPDFLELLKYTRDRHIVPNFTTRNLKWLKENISNIKDVIGSCAVSVDNVYQIESIATIRDFYSIPSSKICVQYVLGVNKNLLGIVKKCCELRVPLTLLGYKNVGRGNEQKPLDYSNWLQVVKEGIAEYRWCKIGIDTSLVKQSEGVLVDSKLPEWLYHKDEGVFSWYIDAVDKVMGSSSYEATIPYKNIYRDFMEQYTTYGNEYKKSIV